MRIAMVWTRLEWPRRRRSLAVLALLVAFSTATVLTAVAGARRGQTAFGRLWAQTLPATVTVLPNQPGFDWARIRALPEVAALTTFAVSGFTIIGYPQSSAAFPPGDSQALRTIERPAVLAGRVFDPRRVDEVVVTPAFAANFGKGVGDTLTIQLATPGQIDAGQDPYGSGYPARGPMIRVRIVGVVRSPFIGDSVGSPGMVVASPALLARYRANILGSHDEVFINALVRLKGGEAAIPRLRADLAKLTGRRDIDVWDNLHDFGASLIRVDAYEAACLLAFGLAALAAALLLVGQSVSRHVSATVTDLQPLRAVGIAPLQVTAAASVGPFLAAAVGATLGVAAAIVASRWMPIGAASLVEPDPGMRADWAILGPGWLAAPLLVLAGAALGSARSAAAGRTQGPPRRSAIARAATTAGAPVPVLIGTRFALEPGRGRSTLPVRPALAGAVVGVLGVLAAFTFAAGISDAAANPARFGQTAQLGGFLGVNGQDVGPAGRLLRAVAASHDVIGVDDARIAVAQSGRVSITTYTYDPVGGKRLPIVLLAGRMPAGPSQTALAATTARDLKATVGSVIRIVGGNALERVRVTGIGFVPDGPHNQYDSGAWLTSAGYDRLFRGARYSFKFHEALVALRPGASPVAAARRLNTIAARLAGGPGRFGFYIPPLPQTVLEVRDVAALPLALGAFLVLLAAGAVGNALAMAVRRRGDQLAVLRALGITRPQSRLVVLTQASVFAVIGLVFGLPAGVVLGQDTWRLVAQETPLAYHPPLAVLVLALVGPLALLAASLLAAGPAERAARLPIALIMRAE